MSRFLDADKVLVFKLYDDLTEEFYEKEFTIQNFIDTYAVDGCPQVVDAEPIRHGHWEKIDTAKLSDCTSTTPIYKCSFCHSPFAGLRIYDYYHYCPNCGAKMDEVKE